MKTALVLPALACLAVASLAPAQTKRQLLVATKESPPFAMQVNGTWTGLSIELWETVAAELGLEFRYEPMELVPMLERTAAGEVDLAVAALTITADRERELDFTHSFLASGLGIATRAQESNVVAALASRVFSAELMQALAALAVVLLVCGAAVWWFERRANPDQFGGPGMRGLGAGFWFSAVTMTTVGYGDKAPVSLGGRLVALVWMFASIIVISSYTAAIASALTVDRMSAAVRGPEDLPNVRIGTVNGSSSTGWLDDRGLLYRGYDRVEQAVKDLADEQIDAVVYDAPILQHSVRPQPDLVVLPHVLRREQYAIALPPGSALRSPIDEKLLQVLESEDWGRLLTEYLGQ